jgi:hypothetical protein
MRKMLLAFLLLIPGQSVAGPPEEASGKMVLDDVAAGLRRYRREPDVRTRITLLKRLAATHDPRVGVALWESQADPSLELCLAATRAYAQEFIRGDRGRSLEQAVDAFESRVSQCEALGLNVREMWRRVNGCGLLAKEEMDFLKDMYLRAKQLPD